MGHLCRRPEEEAFMDKKHYLDGSAMDLETNAKQIYAQFREAVIDAAIPSIGSGTKGLKDYQMGKVFQALLT